MIRVGNSFLKKVGLLGGAAQMTGHIPADVQFKWCRKSRLEMRVKTD